MDNDIKESFIKVLKEIIDGDLTWVDTDYGICFNLSELSEKGDWTIGYNFVEENCSDWPMYSGNSEFPISGYDDRTNWQGEQLELRQSLAQHLLIKLEEGTYD